MIVKRPLLAGTADPLAGNMHPRRDARVGKGVL